MAAAAAPRKRFALFMSKTPGPEDAGVAQVLQAYGAVLDPFLAAYALGPEDLAVAPPIVAAQGLPALYDSTSGVRSPPGNTARVLLAVGMKASGGTAAGAASAPPPGTGGTRAPPAVAVPAVPPAPTIFDNYGLAKADVVPAGGGAMAGAITSGTGRPGYQGFARAGCHGMAWAEYDSAAKMEQVRDPLGPDFGTAIGSIGPVLPAGDAGVAAVARSAAMPVAASTPHTPGWGGLDGGRGPPPPAAPAGAKEKRTGDAEAEALERMRTEQDRLIMEQQRLHSGGFRGPAVGGGPPGGGGAAAAAAAAEVTARQQREATSGLMLTRPLGTTSLPPQSASMRF